MADTLAAMVRSRLDDKTRPPTLALRDVAAIAAATGATRREVEISALAGGAVPRRYLRLVGTLGVEGLLALRRARVAVVGAGGLGGAVVEHLARFGVGELVVADADLFSEDNLNRQLLCDEGNIGEGKAAAAARRAGCVNSAVEILPHRLFVDDTNADALFAGCRLVVDALDEIPSRLVLQRAAARCGIPFIHGAVAGWIGELMTVFPGDPGLEALYGGEGPASRKGIEVELGVSTPTPAAVAAMQAAEAVKLIAGIREPVRNRVLFIDLAAGTTCSVPLGPGGGAG